MAEDLSCQDWLEQKYLGVWVKPQLFGGCLRLGQGRGFAKVPTPALGSVASWATGELRPLPWAWGAWLERNPATSPPAMCHGTAGHGSPARLNTGLQFL